MPIMLLEPFKSLWLEKDPFTEVELLQGEVYREFADRKTLRTLVNNKGYFVKIHRGIGYKEIIKNLLTAKLPVLGAEQEYKAIKKLQQLNIPTMTTVAFGQKGCNPAKRQSFIITEELAPIISLEDYSINWATTPPAPAIKYALIQRVAKIVGTMHRAGINHRDCYICHFLLHTDQPITPNTIKLSVIDLHRAQIRNNTPTRWCNKDLAALYFSTLEIGLSKRDKLRFIKHYFQQPLRECLIQEKKLLTWLEHKAQKLYQRKARYGDAL